MKQSRYCKKLDSVFINTMINWFLVNLFWWYLDTLRLKFLTLIVQCTTHKSMDIFETKYTFCSTHFKIDFSSLEVDISIVFSWHCPICCQFQGFSRNCWKADDNRRLLYGQFRGWTNQFYTLTKYFRLFQDRFPPNRRNNT